jgi:hypothetical protein
LEFQTPRSRFYNNLPENLFDLVPDSAAELEVTFENNKGQHYTAYDLLGSLSILDSDHLPGPTFDACGTLVQPRGEQEHWPQPSADCPGILPAEATLPPALPWDTFNPIRSPQCAGSFDEHSPANPASDNSCPQTPASLPRSSPSTPGSASAPRKRKRIYECPNPGCDRTHDRKKRAEDCCNERLGKRPYECGGSCRDTEWYALISDPMRPLTSYAAAKNGFHPKTACDCMPRSNVRAGE